MVYAFLALTLLYFDVNPKLELKKMQLYSFLFLDKFTRQQQSIL